VQIEAPQRPDLHIVGEQPAARRLTMWWLARGAEHVPGAEHTPGAEHGADDHPWLSQLEADRAGRMRYTKRRSEFLIARWTAKHALARVLKIAPTPADLRRLEVRHAPSGAPLPYLDGEPLDLQISLTDRADWAVCVVDEGTGRIGCDLELVEPRTDGFVRDYLTPAEQSYVDSATDATDATARALAANLIWSAKESALKVLTTGLRRDTRSVEVEVSPNAPAGGWAALSVRAIEGPVFPGWWCRFGDYILTVAAEEPLPAPTTLDDPPLLLAANPTHGWVQRPTRSAPSPAPERQ
jgi:4'-phosphopantetheinyl transferase